MIRASVKGDAYDLPTEAMLCTGRESMAREAIGPRTIRSPAVCVGCHTCGMAEVVLGSSGGDSLAIRVARRKFPEARDYWDGNWVDAVVSLKIRPWQARYNASLRTEDFANFRRDLESLYDMTGREAKFHPMEPWLELALRLDALGHIHLNGEAAPEGYGRLFGQARLVFELKDFMDQSFLPPIVQQLADIEQEFPVIGRPSD
jgi:hypothetical protein